MVEKRDREKINKEIRNINLSLQSLKEEVETLSVLLKNISIDDEEIEYHLEQGFILPEILTAADIAEYLKISRASVYELFKVRNEYGGIPNFSIGTTKRARKKDFLNWLEKNVNND